MGILASLPGQTNGVGVFNDVLIRVTGLGRTDLSWAYCVGTIVSGLNLTKGGRLLDHFGCRRLVVHAAVFLGLILVCLANVDHLALWLTRVFGFMSAAVSAFLLLSVLFALLRFSGQGMLVLISRQMIGKWFNRRRGTAAAFAGIATSLAFGLTPTFFQYLINDFGWRGAWYILALVSALFMSFFGWLFFRDNPEECGLEMDGGLVQDAHAVAADAADMPDEAAASAAREEEHFTLAQAQRSWAFWLITLSLAMQGVVGTAIPFHIDQFAAEHGMTKETALTLFIPMAVIAPTVGWFVGWACDRYPMTLLLRIMCAFQALGFVALSFLGTTIGWYACITGLAVSGGFFGPLSTVAMPYFFGRQNLGAISGTMMKIMVIGSAIGPLMFAYSHQIWGQFMPACLLCTLCPVLILAFSHKAIRPRLD